MKNKFNPVQILLAHTLSGNNREILALGPQTCGCFCCGELFDSREIDLEALGAANAAQCPYCAVDAVIPSLILPQDSADELLPELLVEMHDLYFADI